MSREFHDAYRQLMTDPGAWADYIHERDEWLGADLAGLPVAAGEEYPEYNE